MPMENKYLVTIKYEMWDGHLARQQARSLFHYLTIKPTINVLTAKLKSENNKPTAR